MKLFALSDQQYIFHARPTYSQLLKYLVYGAALLQLCRLHSSTTQRSTINCKICPLIVTLNICVLTVLTTVGKCSEFFSSSFRYRTTIPVSCQSILVSLHMYVSFRHHSCSFRSILVSFRFIPVHSVSFWCHSGLFRYHSGSFRYHSGLFRYNSGSFRLIPFRSCF